MVLDQAGGEVPVSTSNFWWQRGALPGDFAHGFVMVIQNPYIAICAAQGTLSPL
jgi:hypothetical protein